MEAPTPGRARGTVNDPDSEAASGSVDAVADTPGVAPTDTKPGSPFTVVAPQDRSVGGNKLVWLAILVAVGIVLAYAAGMLQ